MAVTRLFSEEIYEAERQLKPIDPLTETYPDITAEEAYRIQLQYVERRLADGVDVVGKKIGLTSRAMQEMLGVDRPDYGHLLDDMIFESDVPVEAGRFIAPRVEFEIAFVLKKDIDGADATAESVRDAIDYVIPAAEIIDSRIRDWKIKFEDTVADNGSSAGAVLGRDHVALNDIDLPSVEMTVYKNGEKLDEGLGSAVLGNPLEAVVWLSKALHQYGISLKAGEVVLAGALTKAVDVVPGDQFKATFEGLGEVEVSFS
ncbi:2-keto-4-pentenoate hydratase [Salinicoccus roseus]|uniref:2-keto-4-pentenoate hydratase n=1 Tax=Salinicoccus roseus TaxID=45670 RepID=A0A0C2HKZ6_9STAP|nr:2-keto-4-pentenoate hydratase [Salinicoccus roseus]KIH70266.1 2-keto-4-pentenoate hydratase [Salinicoccus roseus]MDB0581132.1 2-keto-4-pentenoate hydratase [Salinicoccus roseus]